MGVNEIIERYYIKYKYPNLNRLYEKLQDDDISVTKKQVKEFLDTQTSKQITQQKKVFKSAGGHIVAFEKNEMWQIDQFFLPKYHKQNKGYKYIFCAIDVFTRKAYCIALKHKDNEDVIEAIQSLFDKKEIPQKIMSDSDSVFTSNDFDILMGKYNIIHETVPINDHESLGIVDRFARTLKQRLTDIFLGNDDTNWIDYLDEVVDDYNNSKNRGILKLKPNKVNNPENIPLIVHLNHLKSLKNNTVTDLKIGDSVRIYTKGLFDKGTDPQYSNEVYTVKHIKGKTITLNNDERKRRNDLLLVPANSVSTNTNVIKTKAKEHKIETKLKALDANEENILEGKRIRKANSKYA
jgi:transposase InsO family protein